MAITMPRLAVLVIAVLCLVAAQPATAHFFPPGVDSVDSSTSPAEIRYQDFTNKDTARQHAAEKWEELPGGVNIAPDNGSTIADLEWMDYNRDDGNCGYWLQNPGADNIKLNDHYWGRL